MAWLAFDDDSRLGFEASQSSVYVIRRCRYGLQGNQPAQL